MQHGIIILGGHVQALGILRIYGNAGIPGIIIDKTAANIARHSKYCKLFYEVNDEDLLDFLYEWSFRLKFKGWIIFPTNDFHVKILSQNKKFLEESYLVSTDQWDTIQHFYNKTLTYQLVHRLGIPFPKTWTPSSLSELSSSGITFPCIIKPAVMHDFYRITKKKVFVCRNEQELIENYKIAMTIIPSDEIIIQDIIPGLGQNQFSACFLFLNHTVFVSLTACRVRQHPIDFGNATTYAETIDLPLLLDYGEKILSAVNYQGICEVEFKYDFRDDTYKFLEVNPRTWKWHTIANKSETPFLPLFYDQLTGKNIAPVIGFKQASFRHFLTDFPVQLQLIVKKKKYRRNLKKPIENAVWSTNDFKPWLYEKLYLINLIKNR